MSKTSETKNKIIELLSNEDVNLTGLSSYLKLKPSTVVQHMKELEEMGVVKKINDPHFKNIKYYSLNKDLGQAKVETRSKLIVWPIAIIIIVAAVVSLVYFGSQATALNLNKGKGMLSILLTDPPKVPYGTQGVIVTYSSINVSTNSGSHTVEINQTINLMSILNKSDNLMEMQLPSNTTVNSITINLSSAQIIFENETYPVMITEKAITIYPKNLKIEQGQVSGILIQMSPTIYQNITNSTKFTMIPSISAVAMENMS
jgi:DNA-binding transcriptional ArsR family regulator